MTRLRAAIYCRISDDRTGEGLGVARQQADCEALVEREGWDAAVVHVDNDISAFSGKDRPAYRQLIADLEAGRADAVVAWIPDRLYRSMRDLEDFIDTVERAGVQVRTVMAGHYDLSTASGRMAARHQAVGARYESELKAERIRRKMVELAEAGKSNGGPRSFGYEPDHNTIREHEAALVREAARRALAGESLRAIAASWNERGIPTVRAADGWTYQAMRRMLLSPRLTGLRAHKGEVVGPAVWPAIIDRETHERLKARLASRKGGPTNRVRTRLLTGLIHCGRCDARLYAKNGNDGVRLYRCVKDPGRGQTTSCGSLSVVAGPLDEAVGKLVLAALSGDGLSEALAEEGDTDRGRIVTRLTEQEARLEQLAADHAAGDITRAEWRAARQRLVPLIEDARRDLQATDASSVLASLPTATAELRARWEDADVSWRRAVVDAVVERVTVAPKGKAGGNRFDPDRIAITWRV